MSPPFPLPLCYSHRAELSNAGGSPGPSARRAGAGGSLALTGKTRPLPVGPLLPVNRVNPWAGPGAQAQGEGPGADRQATL